MVKITILGNKEREHNMYDVKEPDWKLYRSRIADWQENYMERLCKEYIRLLASNKNASDRFWELNAESKRIVIERV